MFNSLKKKVLISFILITLICIISITGISVYNTKKTFSYQMKKTGETIANISKHAVNRSDIYNSNKVSPIFESIKNEEKDDIIYISLMDKNGKILAHTESTKIGQSGSKDDIDKVLNGENVGRIYKQENGVEAYKVFMPFSSGDKIISVGISLSGLQKDYNSYIRAIFLIALLVLGIVIVISVLLSNNIVKPLKLIVNRMEKVANGDFSVEFHAKAEDEIGKLMKSLNYVMTTLRDFIKRVQSAASDLDGVSQNLSASSEEITSSGEEISKSIEEVANDETTQASAIEDITEYVENFSTQLDLIQDRVSKVLKSGNNIKESADVGSKDIRSLVVVINDMKKAFEYSAEKITFLDKNVGKITEVMDVINAVAEQTNLLALNAAIEAARAGESGKGFSVVAEEIRKLAEQVLDSSKSITELVKMIMDNTKEVYKTTELVSDKMKTEMKNVDTTVESFHNIVEEVEKAIPYIENAYSAVDKSISEKDKIVKSIEDVNGISSQTAAAAQEISATIENQTSSLEELSASAEELTSMADEFARKVSEFSI